MKNKIKIRIFVCCAFLTLFFGFKLPNVAAEDVNMETPTIDGVIGIAEWMNADVYEIFFIDAENTDGNIDANNSLYIGEDDENLYIGIDLNSDQSPNITGEWVGVWLNTNNRTFDNEREWESYVDNGTESFIYNVENDSIWDPWKDDGSMEEVLRPFEEESEVQTINGTTSDGIFELNNGGYLYDIISNATTNAVWMNFAVNISDWYSFQEDLQINMTEQVHIDIRFQFNVTISSHTLLVWYPNGSYIVGDSVQNFTLPTSSGWNNTNIYIDSSNKSSDNMVRFSLIADHDSPFKLTFDVVKIYMIRNATNDLGELYFSPYTTINNAQINYSFTGSSLNASAHRQFEIKIPKSELEHYNSTNELGIIVGGYGTLNFDNTNYWSYSTDLQTLPAEKSDEYIYFNMSESGGLPPSSPVITTQNQTINTSSVLVDWDTVTDALQYRIYVNGTLNATLVNTNQTISPLTNGKYLISVTAMNVTGESSPSSELEIIVEIPPNLPDSPTISTTTQTISFDNITIQWNIVTGATSYNLYVNGTLNETTASTSEKVMLWVNGTYIIYVTAVNGSGESDPSNSITITVEIQPEKSDPGAFNDTVIVFLSTSGAIVAMILLIIKGRKPE